MTGKPSFLLQYSASSALDLGFAIFYPNAIANANAFGSFTTIVVTVFTLPLAETVITGIYAELPYVADVMLMFVTSVLATPNAELAYELAEVIVFAVAKAALAYDSAASEARLK
jgi:hypothetical protein